MRRSVLALTLLLAVTFAGHAADDSAVVKDGWIVVPFPYVG